MGEKVSRSVVRVRIHLVWATKLRYPWLTADIRPRLALVVAGILRRRGCRPIEIGGWLDHLHVYLGLSPDVAVAPLVMCLKANSTRWVRSNIPALAGFEWQRGFWAYSVDPRNDSNLREYIRTQEQIHSARDREMRRVAT
jgi:putative transposase